MSLVGFVIRDGDNGPTAYFLISHLVIPEPSYDEGQSVYVPSRYASERQGCKSVVDSG